MSNAPAAYDIPTPTSPYLREWTPAQVDVKIAEIYGRADDAMDQILRLESEKEYYVRRLDPQYWLFRANEVEKNQAKVDEFQAKIDAKVAERKAILAETKPYDDEFNSRPWTRAWIVTSSDGHVHNTMDCTTCNKMRQKRDGTWSAPTKFGWLPEVSGLPEDEIIMLAGEGACTVCYPSAPADVLNNPCRLDTAERKAQKAAAQAEKDVKAAERIAKGVTPTGRPLNVSWSYDSTRWGNPRKGEDPQVLIPYVTTGHKEIKTERAAEMWVVEHLALVRKFKAVPERRPVGYDHPTDEAAEVVIEALATKRGLTRQALVESLEKKIAAKVKRGF